MFIEAAKRFNVQECDAILHFAQDRLVQILLNRITERTSE